MSNNKYLLMCVLLVVFGCSSGDKNSSTVTKDTVSFTKDSSFKSKNNDSASNDIVSKDTTDQDTVTSTPQHVSDTLIVEQGKDIVIGYTLSQAEYDELSPEDKSNTDETISDFTFYLEEVAKKFEKEGIKFTLTGARYIKVGKSFFDKKEIDEIGIIIVRKDGKDSVSTGVGTDTDLTSLLNEFYNLNVENK